jgi:glycosyltransferase involved in cell wall biosynthesis
VASLVKHIKAEGGDCVIAAPSNQNAVYEYGGVRVRRYAVSDGVVDLAELYGDGDRTAANNFADILDGERPDILHLHAFTRGVSLRMLREAKKRNIRTVFTYHTPTVSCQRGTMMLWGEQSCDGRLDPERCSACVLEGHGLPKMAAGLLARLPLLPGVVNRFGLSGGLWTALRMPALVKRRHASVKSLFAEADQLVAVCQWVRQVMLVNGVPEGKVTLCRQGIDITGCEYDHPDNPPRNSMPQDRPLRLVFLGRIAPEKGVHIVLEALALDPTLDVRLDVYGISQTNDRYQRKVMEMIAADKRVALKDPVPSNQIITLLKRYHALLVPSQCLETGPLVVLEAFAAGIAVIGSNLGGIAELLQHDGGRLVLSPGKNTWIEMFRTVARDGFPHSSSRFRMIDEVAGEMLALYESLA